MINTELINMIIKHVFHIAWHNRQLADQWQRRFAENASVSPEDVQVSLQL